jgi:ActR/RegA family two-component response regulator
VARILVIDDDATVGVTLGRMLELQGHVVTRVETASDGLSAAATAPPDAVILDMRSSVSRSASSPATISWTKKSSPSSARWARRFGTNPCGWTIWRR